jgi:tRNA(adenine34) deaminase
MTNLFIVLSSLSRQVFLTLLMLMLAACTSSVKQPSPTVFSQVDQHSSDANILLPPGSHRKEQCGPYNPVNYEPTPSEQERDNIYQLAAYGVVYKGWQTKTWSKQPGEETARGYNIGSILVDTTKPLGEGIVCWARNTVITTKNGTQHGEVRLMTNYLTNASISSLKNNFKLYTTLEPCSMCGGMMTLQSLPATLYGQTDPDFGDGIQRLEVNAHDQGAFCPYPRGVFSNGSDLEVRVAIDQAYHAWMDKGNKGLTSWLVTDEARQLFEQAVTALNHWQVKYPENELVLKGAINYLTSVPAEYQALPYTIGCSGE